MKCSIGKICERVLNYLRNIISTGFKRLLQSIMSIRIIELMNGPILISKTPRALSAFCVSG